MELSYEAQRQLLTYKVYYVRGPSVYFAKTFYCLSKARKYAKRKELASPDAYQWVVTEEKVCEAEEL